MCKSTLTIVSAGRAHDDTGIEGCGDGESHRRKAAEVAGLGKGREVYQMHVHKVLCTCLPELRAISFNRACTE